jgi:hypothetical protein
MRPFISIDARLSFVALHGGRLDLVVPKALPTRMAPAMAAALPITALGISGIRLVSAGADCCLRQVRFLTADGFARGLRLLWLSQATAM